MRRFLLSITVLCVARFLMLLRGATNRIAQHPASKWAQHVLRYVPKLKTYQTPAWLVGGVLQTVAAELAKAPSLAYRRETIELPELRRPDKATCCSAVVPAGVVSIDWLGDASSKVLVLVIVAMPAAFQAFTDLTNCVGLRVDLQHRVCVAWNAEDQRAIACYDTAMVLPSAVAQIAKNRTLPSFWNDLQNTSGILRNSIDGAIRRLETPIPLLSSFKRSSKSRDLLGPRIYLKY